MIYNYFLYFLLLTCILIDFYYNFYRYSKNKYINISRDIYMTIKNILFKIKQSNNKCKCKRQNNLRIIFTTFLYK